MILHIIIHAIEISVSFSKPTHDTTKNSGLVKAMLLLNNSVATDVNIQVRNTDGMATGK